MLQTKFSTYGARICLVKILSYEDRNLQGTMGNPSLDHEISFTNLTQLLLSMDALFDELNAPQSTMSKRAFDRAQQSAAPLSLLPEPEQPAAEPPLATFRIDVLFRQNASWQGNVVWLEQKQEAQFRSALELVNLLDSALTA